MNKNYIKPLLYIAGAVEILVGLLHFFMMNFVLQSRGFSSLSSIESEFVALIVYCVGILLIAFGLLTFYFGKNSEKLVQGLYYYLFIKIILWGSRVVLEIIYPVNIQMFFIEPFTKVVFPGLIIEFLLFLFIFIKVKKKNLKEFEIKMI
ncbi:MAG: hypothetical protein P8Y22_08555 [Sulfurimonas sp.]|jgi:hypothetical protein